MLNVLLFFRYRFQYLGKGLKKVNISLSLLNRKYRDLKKSSECQARLEMNANISNLIYFDYTISKADMYMQK